MRFIISHTQPNDSGTVEVILSDGKQIEVPLGVVNETGPDITDAKLLNPRKDMELVKL